MTYLGTFSKLIQLSRGNDRRLDGVGLVTILQRLDLIHVFHGKAIENGHARQRVATGLTSRAGIHITHFDLVFGAVSANTEEDGLDVQRVFAWFAFVSLLLGRRTGECQTGKGLLTCDETVLVVSRILLSCGQGDKESKLEQVGKTTSVHREC